MTNIAAKQANLPTMTIKDPISARPSGDEIPGFEFGDMIAGLGHLLRGTCLVGIFTMLVIAAYFAVQVFFRIGALVSDPATAQESVAAIGRIISADKLRFQPPGQDPIEVGDLVSFLLLLFCYVLWLYVPATLISVCSRVLLRSIGDGKKRSNRSETG